MIRQTSDLGLMETRLSGKLDLVEIFLKPDPKSYFYCIYHLDLVENSHFRFINGIMERNFPSFRMLHTPCYRC